MDLPKVVRYSRNFAALVKVEGPDPKGLKMRKHAFHHYQSGNTTLSASGFLFPSNVINNEVAAMLMLGAGVSGQNMALVLTVASVVEPFLKSEHRTSISQGPAKLIPGARIEIMVEGMLKSDEETRIWAPADLLSLVDVPISSAALQSLIESSLGSKDSGWDVGWSLVSADNGSMPSMNSRRHIEHSEPLDAKSIAKSATRMALLGVSLSLSGQPNINFGSLSNKGDTLVALGSPFGILSPAHFFNCVSTGSIANCYPSGSPKKSLMIADIRCLPGTEGAPVFDKRAHLIGILIKPLRQKNSGVEIQLVVPWEAITTACSELLLEKPSDERKVTHWGSQGVNIKPDTFVCHSPEGTSCEVNDAKVAVEKAIESICLITVNDGVWASGVLLNENGLILTNAHLLEPWRFGKGSVYGDNGSNQSFLGNEECSTSKSRFWEQESRISPRKSPFDGHSNIRVRLYHQDSWTWFPAKVVYICKEQLDVALLQLEYVPGKLKLPAIVADYSSPPLGSCAHVVGHGLFGPRCGLSPSICSGVVAKVVHGDMKLFTPLILQDSTEFPVMLETTAAVHPGGSGGAVINSSGHMIGLVTSNARHGAGTIIPHLNFSIPCAVLAPIFKFAQDMKNMEVLQILDQPNEELASIWALMPSLSPKRKSKTEQFLPNLPKLLIEDGNNTTKKGSQFSKFIAETQNMFGKPSLDPRREQGKISRDVIPSKL